MIRIIFGVYVLISGGCVFLAAAFGAQFSLWDRLLMALLGAAAGLGGFLLWRSGRRARKKAFVEASDRVRELGTLASNPLPPVPLDPAPRVGTTPSTGSAASARSWLDEILYADDVALGAPSLHAQILAAPTYLAGALREGYRSGLITGPIEDAFDAGWGGIRLLHRRRFAPWGLLMIALLAVVGAALAVLLPQGPALPRWIQQVAGAVGVVLLAGGVLLLSFWGNLCLCRRFKGYRRAVRSTWGDGSVPRRWKCAALFFVPGCAAGYVMLNVRLMEVLLVLPLMRRSQVVLTKDGVVLFAGMKGSASRVPRNGPFWPAGRGPWLVTPVDFSTWRWFGRLLGETTTIAHVKVPAEWLTDRGVEVRPLPLGNLGLTEAARQRYPPT